MSQLPGGRGHISVLCLYKQDGRPVRCDHRDSRRL